MNISYIVAAPGHGRVKSSRSIDTVKPLAKALDLKIDSHWYVLFFTIKKSFSCFFNSGAGDAKCVAKRVKKLQKSAAQTPATFFNILIVGVITMIQNSFSWSFSH